MLNRARDAGREVELRRHRLTGLTNLPRVREPAGVNDGARRCDGRVATECAGESFAELKAFLCAEAAATSDQNVGSFDVNVGATLLAASDHRCLA